jgi:endonuclease/exonuclease/phosphatase family metal-dependent hydrolase
MRVLVRTWNVFHGNTSPPRRRAFLDEMVRLAARDRPEILCLEELPLWALSRLEGWSGMTAVADVTRRAPLGVLVGRLITALDHGLFRSAFTGQANAILVSPGLELRERSSTRLSGSSEPRRCQAVRVVEGGRSVVVANTHLDSETADEQLLQAVGFIDHFAGPGEAAVLAGDFNITDEQSKALRTLGGAGSLSGATPTGIDHILVRGLHGPPGEPWPVERRTVDGRILSDHAPVDRELT